MLYQLVVYAVSQRASPKSAILYPTTSPAAREARIEVRDPLSASRIGEVSLRPVHLPTVHELVTSIGGVAARHRESLARQLAFGEVGTSQRVAS
jgi:hypothetical protein